MNSAITLSALAERPLWVAWRLEPRGGKMTKVPKGPDGKNAKADVPATWGTRAACAACAVDLGAPGQVGLEFAELGDGSSTAGIDLDACRDPATGELQDWADDVLARFNTYAEVSPSGTGVKLFMRYRTADLPRLREAMGGSAWGKKWAKHSGRDHPPAIELYLGNRYFEVVPENRTGA